MKQSRAGKTYTVIVDIFMIIFSILILYPFLYCLAYSLSDSTRVMTENVVLLPKGFTFANYSRVFRDNSIISATGISVFRAVAGSLWALALTSMAAYAVSKKDLPGNKFFNIFFIVPMYISGGIIPYYVTIHDLHLFNNVLVYILPAGFYAFNMLIVRTYFDTIPASLEESAKIDGANYFKIFWRIILPLSMPVLSVVAMFTAVSQWNSWFDVVLFITKPKLYPLQRVLQIMLEETMLDTSSLKQGSSAMSKRVISPESVRMATLIVTTLPIVIVYPFFQKHFVRGIMIGAVKA